MNLPRYLAAHDRTTVMWDVAVEDYGTEQDQTAEEIVRGTVDGVAPGSIILVHPWQRRATTQAALAPMISQLKDDGYRFVTVDELLALRS
ncbi:MAG: hypothetical protein ACK5LS_09780 [Propioniciclava sp.]